LSNGAGSRQLELDATEQIKCAEAAASNSSLSTSRRIIMGKSWMLAVFAIAAVAQLSPARADDDPRARKVLEEAFNRRYHWSESFKGFSADFTFSREGKSVKGTIKADTTKPRGGVTVECSDEDATKLVSETIASTITHTRATSFEKAFGSSSFSIAGDGRNGGTKIALEGHGFFKDFTVKDGNIVENHGGRGDMASEVKVQQIVWLAETGKTLPHAYSFSVKTGDREVSGKNLESWREIDGVWLPAWMRMTRSEGSAAAIESTLALENIQVEQTGR
jgi:hypothetical protein